MSKFFSLTKVLFKTGIEFNIRDDQSKLKTYLMTILVIISLIPLAFSIIKLGMAAYDALEPIGQEGLILSVGFSMANILIFFFGIFAVMGVFYFSKNIETLLPLPFKPIELISSKFIVILIYEYILECFTLLPLLISYGIMDGFTVKFIVYSIIALLTIPIMSIVLAAIIVMVIMNFTNLTNNKDKFKIIGGLLIVIISLGITFFIQANAPMVSSQEALQQIILEGNNSLINFTKDLFPTTKLFTISMLETNFSNAIRDLGIYLAANIISLMIFLIIGKHLYLRSIIGLSETNSTRRKLTDNDYNRFTNHLPIVLSYSLKELRILLRTPAYFLNCVLSNFMWVIVLFFPLFSNQSMNEYLNEFTMYFNIQTIDNMVFIAVFGIIVLSSALSGVTSTSISREGDDFFINKYIPVKYKTQILGKVLTSVFLSTINIIIMIPILLIMFNRSILEIILVSVAIIIGVFSISLINMFFDLFNPKLQWDNEQRAVKQNINLILGIIPAILLMAPLLYIIVKFNLSFSISSLFMIIILSLFSILFYKFIANKGVKLYENIN